MSKEATVENLKSGLHAASLSEICMMTRREATAVTDSSVLMLFWAYGKSENGNKMETGNGNWKRKSDRKCTNRGFTDS